MATEAKDGNDDHVVRVPSNDISVQSSWTRRRCTAIVITVIVCGLVLLLTAIIIPIVVDTQGLHVKNQAMATKTTISSSQNETVTAASTITVTRAIMYSWSEWSSWEPHNVTCGYGRQRRMRSCIATRLRHYGMLCKGPSLQQRNYNLTDCRDCNEWYHLGKTQSNGIYSIDPDTKGHFNVYCDMTRDDGGWTVFQRRQDGSEDFYRNWDDYKTGFGNLSGEFWQGNEKIHRLTLRSTSLRIDLQDWDMNVKYAKYRTFKIGSSLAHYKINVGVFSGTAGDSLSFAHNNMEFSTKDNDHDIVGHNCAEEKHGAWWYSDCHDSNLNGLYMRNTLSDKAVTWYGFNHSFRTLKFTEMKLKSLLDA